MLELILILTERTCSVAEVVNFWHHTFDGPSGVYATGGDGV